jgi:hypothetical protein
LFAAEVWSSEVKSPEAFWGFELGTDHKILKWSKIVEYFGHLEENTDRLKLTELGRSTEDEPVILAAISTPLNLANLAKYRNLQNQAANPSHLSERDVQRLSKDQKAFILVLMNNFTNSVATSYASVDLAYLLATTKEQEILPILENSIIFLVPAVNPDGLRKTEIWYNRYIGSEFEAAPLPWAPHRYTGIDLEHDWEGVNLRETQIIAKHITTWPPVAVILCSAERGSPVYFESVSSKARLGELTAMEQWLDKEIEGLAEICRETGECGHSILQYHHALTTKLTVNDIRVATPDYYPPGSNLNDGTPRETPGWVGLREIINGQTKATIGFIRTLSRDKALLLAKYVEANKMRTDRPGERTYLVLPAIQRDPGSLYKVLRSMLTLGVKIEKAISSVQTTEGNFINAGDYLMNTNQEQIKFLTGLSSTNSEPVNGDSRHFPVDRKDPRNLFEMYGLDYFSSVPDTALKTEPFEKLTYPTGTFEKKSDGNFYFSTNYNNAYLAINRLIEDGKDVHLLTQATKIESKEMPAGSVFIKENELKSEVMEIMARGLSLDVLESESFPEGVEAFKLRKYRMAVYSPWFDNPYEGWMRFVLDNFEFKYETIHNSMIQRGKLDFDIVVMPDQSEDYLVDGIWSSTRKLYEPGIPEQYTGGIGEEGFGALGDFVEKGGTLVALNRSCIPVIKFFGLPFESPDEKGRDEALISRIKVISSEPIAFGQTESSSALVQNSPNLRPIPWSGKTSVVAMFEGNTHQIPSTTAIAEVPMGKGRIVLVPFHAMYRAQTQASFKFIFNTILLSKAEKVILK